MKKEGASKKEPEREGPAVCGGAASGAGGENLSAEGGGREREQ